MVSFGNDNEQTPKGNRLFDDCCQVVIPSASMTSSMVRLGDMSRNQLALHFYVTDSMIPREICLDRRQCELLYILQKRIELKEDGTLFCRINFHYSIPKMRLESISHANDHSRTDLLVFITKLNRLLDGRIVLLGDPEVIKEKPISVIVSGVKKLWTPDFVYKRRVEEVIRGYTIEDDPIDTVRAMLYCTNVKALAYHCHI